MDGHGRNADLLRRARRSGGPTIRVNVSNGYERLCIVVPARITFGELKTYIDQECGLEPNKQRLLFEEMERDDQEYLDRVGVNDNAQVSLVEKKKRTFEEAEGSGSSAAEVRVEKELGSVEATVEDLVEKENRLKALTDLAEVRVEKELGSVVVIVEDQLEKENRLKALTDLAEVRVEKELGSVEVVVEDLLEKEKRLKALTDLAEVRVDSVEKELGSVEFIFEDPLEKEIWLKALADLAEVRAEVDKLSEQVAALKGVVNGGTQAGEKEILDLTELLMRQLLKLDSIKAIGEGMLPQRRLEVDRVNSFLNTLDSLKGMNSNPLGNDSRNV